MHKIKWLLLIALGVMLGGCGSFSGNAQHPGKLERVGVLLLQNCTSDDACAKFSLLEADMQSRHVALAGRIDAGLQGQLIAILGVGSGEQNGLELIQVEQTREITQFDYKPFLDTAVADYVQKQYSCTSLWDQKYAWRLDGRQPVLISTLTNPLMPDAGMIHLEFDGLTKSLLAANSEPESANPCQLR